MADTITIVKAAIEATNIEISNLEHILKNGYFMEETDNVHKEMTQKLERTSRYRRELKITLEVLERLGIT